MAERCGCTPGTPENGWHEERSEGCLAREREAFSRVLARLPEIVASIRRNRQE
jgi:hypothetical protein